MSRITILANDGTMVSEIAHPIRYFPAHSTPKLLIPESRNKMEQIHQILGAFESGEIPLLFDSAMKSSDIKARSLQHYEMGNELHNTAVIFFTSGTTGNPIGVLKRASHLESECEAHLRWLSQYSFEQCVVSVPFFHIYGFLFGLSIPLAMGLDIVTKEDFLPHEILKLCQMKPTLSVTNPVFIRAMLRLKEDIDLSHCLFISSSGPLENTEAFAFEQKYSTRLIQLYGSSETGGIAIREGGEAQWSPLEGVITGIDDGRLCVESPYLSERIFDTDFQDVSSPFVTTDIIETVNGKFKIVGRASELVKIGGKRLSIVEIESFVESLEGIEEALGFVEYHPGMLRGETLSLYLVGDEVLINKTVLKKALHDQFGGIHIESKIMMVESLPKTALGKKIRQKVVTS